MIYFLVIITISLSLISLSYANTYWQTVSVDSPIDNKTKYLFHTNNIESTTVLYYDKWFYHSLFFNTTQITDDQIQFKTPKNFPTDPSYNLIVLGYHYDDDTNIVGNSKIVNYSYDVLQSTNFTVYESSYDLYEEDNCFCTYTINITDPITVEVVTATVLATKLDDIKPHTVPDYCLPHTIADYPDSLDTYGNIRGEQVRVYLSSVLELLKRNYLAPIQNDIKTSECR